jgi:predicted transposase/invertase (TIGR01784 family)
MYFTKNQKLLKRFASDLLGISEQKIEEFVITNPEIPPENLGEKFCRLDINMIVDGEHILLEIQVAKDKFYVERSMYYWAREFSTSLKEGQDYNMLPKTIMINILGFNWFEDPNKIHSEFKMLEANTFELLSDKCEIHYFELPKLTELSSIDRMKWLWLKLFSAKTEEEMTALENSEEKIMKTAVKAYRRVVSSSELREMERLRLKASHDEATALKVAAEAAAKEAAKRVRDEKDAEIAALALEKDAAISEKDTIIAALRAELDRNKSDS